MAGLCPVFWSTTRKRNEVAYGSAPSIFVPPLDCENPRHNARHAGFVRLVRRSVRRANTTLTRHYLRRRATGLAAALTRLRGTCAARKNLGTALVPALILPLGDITYASPYAPTFRAGDFSLLLQLSPRHTTTNAHATDHRRPALTTATFAGRAESMYPRSHPIRPQARSGAPVL
jgi:hypothetical protein